MTKILQARSMVAVQLHCNRCTVTVDGIVRADVPIVKVCDGLKREHDALSLNCSLDARKLKVKQHRMGEHRQ